MFRSKIASKLTGTALGEIVTSHNIALLIMHPSGIINGSLDVARIIPFINKMDEGTGLSQAEDLAFKIIEAQHPRMDRGDVRKKVNKLRKGIGKKSALAQLSSASFLTLTLCLRSLQPFFYCSLVGLPLLIAARGCVAKSPFMFNAQ